MTLAQNKQNSIFIPFKHFTGEVIFSKERNFNQHNVHAWSSVNLRSLQPLSVHQCFSVNVWTVIIDDKLIGLYLLLPRSNGRKYHNFLEGINQNYLKKFLLLFRVLCDSNKMVLYHTLPNPFTITWTILFRSCRLGPVTWPAVSPDLKSLDFFFGGILKSMVFETQIHNTDLVTRISMAATSFREMSAFFQLVQQSMCCRCEARVWLM